MAYSSSLRFLEIRSPPVTAARSASPSEALDCLVPVFGNSFAPAFQFQKSISAFSCFGFTIQSFQLVF